ncbi:MAG TPA: cytochrome c3 family protein [Thermoanaerobaculia bacterium]|nr:cytochrome c3 family protein [Thermoanaerobaculia bacterium]
MCRLPVRHDSARAPGLPGAAAIFALLGLAVLLAGCGPPAAGEAPPQPIAFVHSVHVVQEELECTRCHRGAAEQKRAGLPPMFVCVACHRHAIPDHPEVAKLLEAYDAKQPILWRKVNVMPESAMVQFHHGAHARAEVACTECHGDVPTMTVAAPVRQVADMSWCVDCHREREASVDCIACHY